jgi:large subunit ribosomal protein L10
MARPEKEASVADITERFNDSDAALLTEYRGLRVSEIAEVRNSLRDSDTDYKVLKNTLARIAVREVGLEELVEMLTGPTAIAFIKGDAAAAAKALDDAQKKYPVLTIKGGVLNGKVIDAEQAKQLAKLEPREVLLSKIAMLFNQPAQQGVNVFAALLRDLGSMLAQVQAKKESGELPGGAGEAPAEAPAAEATPTEDAPAEDATPEATAEPVETEEAEQAAEAAAEGDNPAADVTEAAAEAAPEETPAEEAATEAEPPAEIAEAVDQAPAAPESDAAETQETTDESATKEEE